MGCMCMCGVVEGGRKMVNDIDKTEIAAQSISSSRALI